MTLDAQTAMFPERNVASWASRGIGIGCYRNGQWLDLSANAGDVQDQKIGMMIHDPLRTVRLHQLTLVRAM